MKKSGKLSGKMTFQAWAEYWMKNTEGFRTMTTDAKYQEILRSALMPAFSETPLEEITEEGVMRFFAEEKEGGRSVARMTQMLTVLAASLTGAVNHNLIPRNPCANLKLPRRIRQECAILTDEDIRNLAKEHAGNPWLPMILIMLFLGLRVGEAIGLDWEKVDMDRREARIDQQCVSYYDGQRTRTKLVPYTKNGVIRTLPLCDAAMEYLREIRDRTAEHRGPVFREGGERVKYASFYYAFNKLMAAIGREDIHPHSLRHTAASTLLYETGDLLLVKHYLGHRSIRTSEGYPEATEQEKREVADALDRFFLPYLKEVFTEEEMAAVGLSMAG